MNPKNHYTQTFIVSLYELMQIFPWFNELSVKNEKPKTKRGRKPKAHRVSDNLKAHRVSDNLIKIK